MDNAKPDLPKSGSEPQPEIQTETHPTPEKEFLIGVKERIKKSFQKVGTFFTNSRDYYRRSPRLQKVSHQGKYLPAFWTVASIFSLLVNLILISALIALGHNFFQLKALVGDGLLNKTSDSLELMDQAHIITTVSAETTVQLKDDLPVVFSLPINQNTQLYLSQATRITNAEIYLNNAVVPTDLTLPANTPITVAMNMTIPVSTTTPLDITVPISLQAPVDIPVEQTDLHQSIVGLQGAIEPYKDFMSSIYNSPRDIQFCNEWWSGWMCTVFFGR